MGKGGIVTCVRVGFLFAFIGVVLLIVAIAMGYSGQDKIQKAYGVTIDAGSSHTGIFVYIWGKKFKGTGIIEEVYSHEVEPGISEYADNPEEAAAQIDSLIVLAKAHIPEALHEFTPVFLAATAGMRVLDKENKPGADRIFAAVRQVLSGSGFLVEDINRNARILSGKDEGLFGWATSNYLAGNFGAFVEGEKISDLIAGAETSYDTLGALDLGGASTQITFRSNETLPNTLSEDITLFEEDYTLYAHSFLCYGSNEASRRFYADMVQAASFSETVQNPCGFRNSSRIIMHDELFGRFCTSHIVAPTVMKNYTFVGAYDDSTEACADALRPVFRFNSSCPECAIEGTYVASTTPNRFMAFSGLYWAVNGIQASFTGGLVSMANYTTTLRKFCQQTGNGGVTTSRALCLNSWYAKLLLEEAYNFNTEELWSKIYFARKVNGFSVGWTMGLMLDATMSIENQYFFTPSLDRSEAPFIVLVIFGVIFLVLSVILCILGRRNNG